MLGKIADPTRSSGSLYESIILKFRLVFGSKLKFGWLSSLCFFLRGIEILWKF